MGALLEKERQQPAKRARVAGGPAQDEHETGNQRRQKVHVVEEACGASVKPPRDKRTATSVRAAQRAERLAAATTRERGRSGMED